MPTGLLPTPLDNLVTAGPAPLQTLSAPVRLGGPIRPTVAPIDTPAVSVGVVTRADRGTAPFTVPSRAGPPLASIFSPSALGGATLETSGATAPAPRQAPAPQTPGGALGAAAGSSTGLYLAGFAVLLLLAAWALPRLARRLDEASALWRPMPFLSLLERPG
jgi:hypothetical protein